MADSTLANSATPVGNVMAHAQDTKIYSTTTSGNEMAADAVKILPAGGGKPFRIMPPYLVMNWIIALQGVFPSRN